MCPDAVYHDANAAQTLSALDSLAHRQAVRLFEQVKDELVQKALDLNGNALVAPSRMMQGGM